MRRIHQVWYERVKFYILILLICTSLLQLGILWSDQKQGFPFHLFPHFFKTSKSSSAESISRFRDELFIPLSGIVSEDYDKPKWLLSRNDKELFSPLWNEARRYLSDVLVRRPDEVYPAGKWGEFVDKKAFMFEFNTNMDMGLVKDFLNLQAVSSASPSGVYKVVLSPWDSATDYNLITIYILDNAKVYKYTTSIHTTGSFTDKDVFANIIENMKQTSESKKYIFYKQTDPQNILGYKSDLPIVFNTMKYREFPSVVCAVPDGFHSQNPDYEKIAQKLLGGEKDSYDRTYYSNKAVEYKTQSIIYNVLPGGIMEYNYLTSPTQDEKGSLGDAFKTAFEFVDRLGLQTGKTKLILSDMQENKDFTYDFTFDYLANEIPVFVNNSDFKDDNGQAIHHAIVIKANSKSVIRCTAILRNFDKAGGSDFYDMDFTDFQDETNKNYSYLKDNKNVPEKDLNVSFVVEFSDDSVLLHPQWILTANANHYIMPMISR